MTYGILCKQFVDGIFGDQHYYSLSCVVLTVYLFLTLRNRLRGRLYERHMRQSKDTPEQLFVVFKYPNFRLKLATSQIFTLCQATLAQQVLRNIFAPAQVSLIKSASERVKTNHTKNRCERIQRTCYQHFPPCSRLLGHFR